MSTTDPLYFPRTELAQRLLTSLKDGISHAFTLFAPRRMGKTQFLLNDITPQAQKMGFEVFYYSFMDRLDHNLQEDFTQNLIEFWQNEVAQLSKNLQAVKKVEFFGVGIEREEHHQKDLSISQILTKLAQANKPVLLLLDEVQELARVKNTEGLIRFLRTGLDINRNQIRVIFTGSSTNGLRAMFNDSKAPFFHFAHHIDFPNLGRDFTDYLADIYQARTSNKLDKEQFYQTFERLNFTPLYLRSITQDMIVNPLLTLEQATEIRLNQIDELSDNQKIWNELNELERLLLIEIANGNSSIYKTETRKSLAEQLGVDELNNSTIQGRLKKLERNELVTRNTDNSLRINSAMFQTWILEKEK